MRESVSEESPSVLFQNRPRRAETDLAKRAGALILIRHIQQQTAQSLVKLAEGMTDDYTLRQ